MEIKDLDNIDFEVNYENFAVKNDYFLFDSDDVELSFLRRKFEQNLNLKKIPLNDKTLAENYFSEISLIYDKADFNDLTFPYLKNSMIPSLLTVKERLTTNSSKGYFLILFFSNLRKFRTRLYSYYYQNIKKHSFGLPKSVEGMMNPELFDSTQYNIFIEKITNWYVKNEFIYFFLQFLSDFFEIRISFDEKEFSIDSNYEMSLKMLMKKSFFKLSAYLLSKLSGFSKSFFLNRALSSVNSNHLAFLLLSTLTYGISLKNFKEIDLKPLGFLAGFFLHYLINYTADSFEKHSNYLEIENMIGRMNFNLEILRKLNKKVEKIRLGLFDLVKASIAEMMEIDDSCKQKSLAKIKGIF
jgi:hypothetical protein